MSHITDAVGGSIFIHKKDLHCLKSAVENYCPDCEFVAGENHYRTWKDDHRGRLVGDWPLPEGWTAAMVGENAKHVIRASKGWMEKNPSKRPYEIGVVPVRVTRDKDGNPIKAVPDETADEYVLMTDWFNQGNGILNLEGVGRRELAEHPVTGQHTEMSFGTLYQHFRLEQLKHEAALRGDTITFENQPDGSIVAQVQTQARLGV